MTDAYGIAAVTAVLRSRLATRLANLSGAGSVTASALPPDRIPLGASEPTQLNLFLHQVTPNAGWRNAGQPAVNQAGEPVAGPPLGLDLHYLMTAYSAEPYLGEAVLGHALQLFHDEPVLTRDTVRAALDPQPDDPTLPAAVRTSGLAEQVELLKVTPTVMSSEELSRLWSALQAHYRPTACLHVSVLLLDSTRTAKPALPVSAVGSHAAPLRSPRLDSVGADGPPGTVLTAGGTLVVRGRRLRGPGARLRFDGTDVALTDDLLRDTELRLPVTAVAPAPRAGLHAVSLRHDVAMGDPPTPHQAVESNPLPVALVPTATATADVDGTDTVEGVAVSTGTITVAVDPPVTAQQRVTLLLNRPGPPPDPLPAAVALTPPAGNAVPSGATETATVPFDYATLPRGRWVLRLVVDGAQSPLAPGGDGRYHDPAVTL